MDKRIIECVPNFSEGRNPQVIKEITDAIEAVEGIRLLDVDPGEATNRTVVTFVGEPEAVMEAALRGVKRASELIDMSKHHGAHPRMGATDVCPLIPVSGVTLEECAEMARALAERISTELGIPTFCYEAAAFTPARKYSKPSAKVYANSISAVAPASCMWYPEIEMELNFGMFLEVYSKMSAMMRIENSGG